ncbi:MAG: hypothetical protein IJW49_00270 [Clostridia bacterium]|nr:hypothetical protein [Clostridia bacterium]
MNYQTVLQDFCRLNAESAEQLKKALSLNMESDTLQFCISHYKTYERRDPHTDELRMLDQLSAILEHETGAYAPTDLFTNDEFVAQTYADLLKKRKELNPNATYPCTLAEAARLGGAYMARSGKSPSVKHASALPEYVWDAQGYPSEGCVSAPDSAFRMRLLPFSLAKACVGDLLVLVSPVAKQTQPQFAKAIERLLECDALQKHLKGVVKVGSTGVLRELLDISSGLRINLASFSAWNEGVPMTVLTNQYGGSRILRIADGGFADIIRTVRELGMNGFAFAQVTGDAAYTFRRSEEAPPFSIASQFMRILFRYQKLRLHLGDEFAKAPSPINHRAVCDVNCRYLQKSTKMQETVVRNGVIAAAAASSPRSAYFKTALYTTLAPILTLCACGIPVSEQLLSVGIASPRDPKQADACMSMILGVYRAQIELAIRAQITPIKEITDGESHTLTAFSLSEAKTATACSFTASEHAVYCLVPPIYESGIPNFRALRAFLSEIVALQKENRMYAASILVGESVTDGIRKMSGAYTCRLTDKSIASDGTLPIALLIEAADELPYPRVGTTMRCEQKEEEVREIEVPQSLIWSETPEIVLLAKRGDSDAQVLASVLECRGANVTLCTCFDSDPAPLSRAMLGAQTLILCHGVHLPTDPRVRFALRTMRDAGGFLLSLDEADAHTAAITYLPHGLSETLLDQICKKDDKNSKKT